MKTTAITDTAYPCNGEASAGGLHSPSIPSQHLGYEEAEGAFYEAPAIPRVEICAECNSPILDGDPAGHREGCKSGLEIEF